MKNHLQILFLFILLLTISINSYAVVSTLTFKGGVSGYKGDVTKDVKIEPMAGLSYEIWLKHFLSIGIHPYYTTLKAGEKNGYNFKTHEGGADILLKLRPFEIGIGDGYINKMAPYVVVGGGLVNYYPKRNNLPVIIPPTRSTSFELPDRSRKFYDAVLPSVGGGLTFMTKYNFNVDLGIQYDFSRTDWLDGVQKGDDKDNFWMGYLGLAFNLGISKDTDGDGILDKNDADPTHPEDFDGFQDKDGAPDPDNDNDGIPDVSDKAPGTDETVAQGINTKEDMDGFQDSDGVPDPDNDNDGILDVNDQAPGTDQTLREGINTKETYNGYQDEDGVPDEVPVVVKEEPKPVVEEPKPVEIKEEVPLNLAPVYFDTAKSVLSKADKDILDMIVTGLIANPDVNLEIQGNCDNTGSEALNNKLSMQRAQAVKNYLTQKGIKADRLQTKGFSADKPTASNDTAEGRAQNRRVELVKI